MVYLAGKVNGNVLFDETVASSTSGDGAQGVAILGGLHACSSDAAAEASAGFTCGTGTSGLGALINNGKIVTVGQVFVNPASKDPVLEGGSTLMVGASIDGGIFNGGPYTANSVAPVGVFSGNGANGNAVVYIDPNLAGTEAAPLHIGPVSSALDSIDAGYSFDNRGSITAAPSAPQVSTVSMFVQGASPNLFIEKTLASRPPSCIVPASF